MQILSLFTHADTGTNTFVVIWSVKHESVKMQHLLLHEIACVQFGVIFLLYIQWSPMATCLKLIVQVFFLDTC